EKGIDRVLDPGRVRRWRDGRANRRPVSPVLARIYRDGLRRGLGTLVDPRAKHGELAVAERDSLALGRHALGDVRRGAAIDEQAFPALAGLDGRPALAAAADELRGVQPESRLLTDRPVATCAPLGQYRLDLASVVDRRRGRGAPRHPENDDHDHRLD